MSRKSFGVRSIALAVVSLVLMPAQAAVITVNTTADTIAVTGFVSLREAITSINNQGDVNADVTANRVGAYASAPGGIPDVINFNISGAGVHVISATSIEPPIRKPLTIDGYSQTGASANGLANADNAVILIQLDGSGAGAAVDGLTLGTGSDGSTIQGLAITGFTGNGLVVQSDGNSIVGNFIGVDPTGTTRVPNGTFPSSGDGVRILNASNNQIGSTTPAQRNIISGNALDGIHIFGILGAPATYNTIRNNFIGVASDGTSSVGNRTEPAPAPGTAEGNNLFGIEISGGDLNTIGGTIAGSRNVIGFNADGIELDNGAQQNTVQGNFCGVGADGVTPAANLLHGIALRSSNGFGAPLGPAQANEPGVSFNLIGGTPAGAGNLVKFNGRAGIGVFGNPVSASAQPNIGNAIEGNGIFENGRSSSTTPLLGIDLTNGFLFPADDGLTPNDSNGHAAANDPNSFQNFPLLLAAISDAGQTTITGNLTNVSPNTSYRIEFFANDADPLSLPAEGQQFIGFTDAVTDANGNASFSPSLAVVLAFGRIVTATATDPTGNTSEFSAGVVASPLITLAPAVLPTATYGVAYSQAITASGGSAPYTFAVTAGALPAGVNLSASGGLAGTPTVKGNFNFTVTATDTNGYKGSRDYAMTIATPTIALAPATLPNGTNGTLYPNKSITASGGIAPYTFAITAGSQPPGLTVNSAGLFSGTPTANGAFNFTVTATDAHGFKGSKAYAVTIAAALLKLTLTDNHAFARYGDSVVYDVTLKNINATAIGGVGISGTAPSGLDLANTQWQCLGACSGLVQYGPFSASGVSVPAASSIIWVVAIPVLDSAPGATITYQVSVTGAGVIAPVTDADTLVIFHDGFNVSHGDGAQ